jgi:vesicle-fusing ATPase
MTGFGDAQKVAYIERQFSDSYKSKSSVIVLDSVERLFSWVPIGPRFSMMVVDALLVLLNKQPPSGHRLLVFATSSIPETLGELGFSFSRELRVRNVETAREVQSILMKYGGLPDYEASSAMQMYGSNDVNVGVKRILSAIDRAKADANVPQSFARLLKELAGMPAAGTVAPPGGQLRVRGADFGGNDADRMIQY